MKRYLCMIALLMIAVAAWAGVPAKSELSLAGGLTSPSTGGSTWSLDGEFLFPVGPFVAGPSFGLFDSPGADGTRYGAAAEWNLGKKAGPFVGAAIHKFGGDFADLAEYDGQARAGFKFGDGNAALKVYAQRTWVKDAAGEVSAPDSTDVVLGIIWKK